MSAAAQISEVRTESGWCTLGYLAAQALLLLRALRVVPYDVIKRVKATGKSIVGETGINRVSRLPSGPSDGTAK